MFVFADLFVIKLFKHYFLLRAFKTYGEVYNFIEITFQNTFL